MKLALRYLTIGGLVGGIAGLLWAFGFLNSWKGFHVPPGSATSLVVSGEDGVLVKTDEGKLYDCFVAPCLQSDLVLTPEDSRLTVIQPCAQSGAAFSLLVNRPSDIVDCLTIAQLWADASERKIHALDADGRLWLWEDASGHMDIFGVPILAGGGALLGFILAVLVGLGRRFRAGR